MMSEPNTSPFGGTDNAAISPSTDIDNPANWDFYDPALDGEDTVEGSGNVAREEEDNEADVLQADEIDDQANREDDSEDVTEPDDGQDEAAEDADDEPPATIIMDDGSELSVDELKKGYLRQDDFTRKTQEISNHANALVDQTSQIEAIVDVFANFVAENLPPEPDPNLIQTDQAHYLYQKESWERGLQQLDQLIAMGQQAAGVRTGMNQDAHDRLLQEENAALLSKMPELADADKRQAFFKDVLEAANAWGFSDEEIQSVTDHRMLLVVRDAKRWRDSQVKAKQAKAVAQEKVRQAKPMAPKKRQPSADNRYVKARKRFNSRPTLENAVHLDF